ncbi:unnamed protein product, partial [Effrenium voratum]
MADGEPRFAVITNFDTGYEVGFQCAAVNDQYCQRWGHRFLPCILLREDMERVCEGRHFAWAKVALFTWLFTPGLASKPAQEVFSAWLGEEDRQRLLQAVDYIVWIDGDAMVLDHGRQLRDFVTRFARKALILAEDMSWADCLNTGVFFARTDSPWLRSFWSDAWHGAHQRFHQAPFWDQSGICQELGRRRELRPQVLGAMATGLGSGPWFSWMGGSLLKETPNLGIWDAASLQFANPLHAQFILHLCGFSSKLKLCRSLCQSGVLRSFSFKEPDAASRSFLWTAAVDLLRAQSLQGTRCWSLGGLEPLAGTGSTSADVTLPVPDMLRFHSIRANWGEAPTVVHCIDGEQLPPAMRSMRVKLWQICDFVRGWPPPCHPVLGKLGNRWCTRWPLPEKVALGGVAAPAQLHLYPPGARIKFHAPGAGLTFWVLSGSVACDFQRGPSQLQEGGALRLPAGEQMLCIALAPTAALCQLTRPDQTQLAEPLGQLQPAAAPPPFAPLGWAWFGDPENWLGAPPGHEPVDQVAAAREKELKAKPFAKVIPHAELALDAADVTVDDGWLDPLAAFLSQACVSGLGLSTGSAAEVLRLAGKPVVEEYVAPACPRVVQVDALHISPIRLTVWCSMRLRNVVFLPSYVRTAIRLISLSGRFTLDGATLSLPKRSLHPYRGSLGDFLRSLAAEYAVNLLRNIGSVLGRSSFFKVPRVPLKLSGTAVSYVTDGIGLAAGEAAALLNELTFDQEFVERQRHQQGAKQIRGLGDGVVEASKSIAQGVEGLLDVVKKPVQGARSSGLGGFLAGVGMGVAGSFVKPVSRLGQAISDVGSGLAAEVTPDSAPAMRRRARTRQRHPRLLFGPVPCVADLGESGQAPQLRPWSLLEAEVQQLGTDRLQGVQEVVPLTQQTSQVTVLLLFTQHCLVAEIILEAMGNEQALQLMSPARSSTAAPSVPRQRSVRRCNFSDITSVEVDESGDLVELL